MTQNDAYDFTRVEERVSGWATGWLWLKSILLSSEEHMSMLR